MIPVRECGRCPALVKVRSCIVNGAGIRDAKIAFVGEGPGYYEDKNRRPFVGKAGRIQKALEWSVGINQHKVFHTNATRCFGQRNPTGREVDNCHDYLIEELLGLPELKVVVTLGGPALRSLYPTAKTIRDVAGFTVYNDELPGIPIIPTYHPMHLGRGHWSDTALVLAHFRKAKRIAETEQWEEKLGSYAGVTTLAELRALRDYLLHDPRVELLSVDTETTGLSWLRDELLCISFSGERGTGFSVPILHRGETMVLKGKKEQTVYIPVPYWADEELEEVWRILNEILSSDKPKAGQNIGFDLRMLERRPDEPAVSAKTALGFTVNNVKHDTRMLSSLLSETLPANLTTLCAYWTDVPYYEGRQISDLTFHETVDRMHRKCSCGKLTATKTINIMREVCAGLATKGIGTLETEGATMLSTRSINASGEEGIQVKRQSIFGVGTKNTWKSNFSALKPTLPESGESDSSPTISFAGYAALLQQNAWSLAMTILRDETGASSVTAAIQDLVSSEILKRLYSEHSPTCAAIEYLQLREAGAQDNFPGIAQFKKKMWHLPDEVLWEYGGADVDVVNELVPRLLPNVQAERTEWIYKNISIPLIQCANRLEERGVYIDKPHFDKLCRHYEQQMQEAQAEVDSRAGHHVEAPGYYQHAQHLLFKELGLPLTAGVTDGAAKGEKKCRKCQPKEPCSPGHAGTSAALLKELSQRQPHPVLDALINYRSLETIYSTFLDGGAGGFRRHIQIDGRIHARWNAARAETGRFSCEEPNLMNPPKEVIIDSTEYDIHSEDAIRAMFGAPPGSGLLNSDWSQLEVWGLAYETGDPTLLGVLQSGQDVHAYVARKLCELGVSTLFPKEVTEPDLTLEEWKAKYPVLRGRGKTFVFGISYQLSEQGAADRLGCSIEEAGLLFQVFLTRVFPSLPDYFLRIRQEVLTTGMVSNRFNRRRHFAEVPVLAALKFSTDIEGVVRQAINMPIQSGGHDLHSLAHIATEWKLVDQGFITPGPVLEMHDSLLIEDELGRLEETARLIKSTWEKVAKDTRLPDGKLLGWEIPVDVKWGPSFGSLTHSLAT